MSQWPKVITAQWQWHMCELHAQSCQMKWNSQKSNPTLLTNKSDALKMPYKTSWHGSNRPPFFLVYAVLYILLKQLTNHLKTHLFKVSFYWTYSFSRAYGSLLLLNLLWWPLWCGQLIIIISWTLEKSQVFQKSIYYSRHLLLLIWLTSTKLQAWKLS